MSKFDTVIIGAGGTGLAAAMYSARLGLKTLVLGISHGSELPAGGVITTTEVVENYPGFKKLSGIELAKKLKEHAESYEEVTINQEKVESVKKLEKSFEVKTSKNNYSGKTIIFATGTKWKKLTAKNAEKFEGKGVNYCSLCDGPLYKNKIVAVVGGSDSAAKDALLLSKYAKKVYIIYRGEKINPEPINMLRVQKNKKIEVINNTNVIEVKGEKFISKVVLDKEYNESNYLDIDGLFVAIGHEILSELAKEIGVKTNKKGEIIIDHKNSKTNIEGVFAAGDVTDKSFKQLITGVADGCTAAHSAYEFIESKEIVSN